jgi:hypothetical protein
VQAEWTYTGARLMQRPLIFLINHGMGRFISRMWSPHSTGTRKAVQDRRLQRCVGRTIWPVDVLTLSGPRVSRRAGRLLAVAGAWSEQFRPRAYSVEQALLLPMGVQVTDQIWRDVADRDRRPAVGSGKGVDNAN